MLSKNNQQVLEIAADNLGVSYLELVDYIVTHKLNAISRKQKSKVKTYSSFLK